MVARILVITAVLLVLWSILEFMTQEKLVGYRNLYAADPTSRFWPNLRRAGEIGTFPIMSFGPYSLPHILAGVLSALGGFLIMGPIKRHALWYLVGSLLLTVAILSTQNRVGFVAFTVLMVAGLYLQKTWRSRLATVCGGVLGSILFVAAFGGADAFKGSFLHHVDARELGTREVDAKGSVLDFYDKPRTDQEKASAQGRIAGLIILLSEADRWWLFGQGPGGMFNGERIPIAIRVIADHGSFFMFMVESGLPVGIALTIIMAFSLRQGLRSEDWAVRSAALGVGSFWVFSLAGVGLYGWTICLVLAGLIEAWSRQTRPEFVARP